MTQAKRGPAAAKRRRVKKPEKDYIDFIAVSALETGNGSTVAVNLCHGAKIALFYAEECRALADWMNSAADWLEQQEKRK